MTHATKDIRRQMADLLRAWEFMGFADEIADLIERYSSRYSTAEMVRSLQAAARDLDAQGDDDDTTNPIHEAA